MLSPFVVHRKSFDFDSLISIDATRLFNDRFFVRFHVGWEENETFFIRVGKPAPSIRVFTNLEGKPLRESPERTIFVIDSKTVSCFPNRDSIFTS